MGRVVIALVLVALASGVVYLINPPYDHFTISSRILGEERTILEHLPPGYDTSGRAYPVLVHLDATPRRSVAGPSLYTIAATVDALEGPVPAMIVLGVTNTHRTRDMIPVPDSIHPPAPGKANEFLRFITGELLPVVDARYRTTGFRVLYGGSDAGLFALYALTAAPDAFQAVIASSPSLQRSPAFVHDALGGLFAERPTLARSLVLVYGADEGRAVTEGVPALAAMIERYAPSDFVLGVRSVPGGGHVPRSGLAEGLRFIFDPSTSAPRRQR